jgi:eukaryotic-like serine/threonine-protein kinase
VESERWKKIDELFDAVLNLPESQRQTFLSKECEGDEDLKNEVLALVESATPTSFLEHSAIGVAARKLAADRNLFTDRRFVGRTIGTYKIEKPIAAGGMGEVYLATDLKFYRKVALKILPAEYTSDDERLKRFELEAHAISCINHPNIVTIFDVGSLDGINFIATELVEGKNLTEAAPDLELTQILDIGIQVCEALSAAHRSGITHRDIKPENIMLRPDGYVKVLDFGLAKLNRFSPSAVIDLAKTAEGVIMGTPGYMSPEQIAGERIDYRTDLWSLGVILFELLTGRNPFKGSSRQMTFTAILDRDPPIASSINPEIPAELDRILARSLEKNVEDRFQSPNEFSEELKQVRRQHEPGLSGGTTTAPIANAATRQRPYLGYPIIGLIVLAIATGVMVLLLTSRAAGPESTDWTKARSVQLTDFAGTEYFPALSPDAKSFVYSSDQTGNYDIFAKRLDGGPAVNLTPHSRAQDTQPTFSPDGKLIAFRSERQPRGIYVMEATGENPRRVIDFGFHPSFSPDGKQIVVSIFGDDQPTVRRSGPKGIWTVNLETGERRQISERDASLPAWSPDGKHVAFWFYPTVGGRRDVALVSLETGKEVVLTADFAVSNWNPVWSPDGNFVYFISDRNGSVNFWRIRVDPGSGQARGEPEPVVAPSTYSRHLNFSRDGTKMIYVQSNNQANIQGVAFDMNEKRVVGDPFWVTSGDREVTRAEVSPDGREFLMRQIRRTQDDIVIYEPSTNTWRDVTRDEPFDRYPRWSPDGNQIAFVSDRTGNYEIWICSPDGRNLRQITFVGPSETGTSFPTWSPDGRRLIYSVNNQSFMIELNKSWTEQTPEPIPMPPDGSRFVVWDWAPDGEKLAGTFSVGKRAVGTYSFQTGIFKKLAEIVEDDPIAIPSWLPDSRYIAYTSANKIFLADIETGNLTELFAPKSGEVRSPFVSRDGRVLYHTIHTFESDVWLLDRSLDE